MALSFGTTVRDAWDLCPCEIGAMRDAEANRQKATDDRLLLAAWASAAWSRLDVLPGPGRCIAWLRDGHPLRTAQTDDEIEAVLEAGCRGSGDPVTEGAGG